MKKILCFVMALAAVGVMSSCGGGSTPGAAAKKVMEQAGKGNYDKFVDGLYFDENASKEEVEQSKVMLKALLADKASKTIEKKGGLESVDVISEEISDDGLSAKVVLKQTYGNGDTQEETFTMVKQDGKWKLKIKK